MVVPWLLYGSKAWVSRKRYATRMQATEMRFLRKLKGSAE
jgi:hypothetical protein